MRINWSTRSVLPACPCEGKRRQASRMISAISEGVTAKALRSRSVSAEGFSGGVVSDMAVTQILAAQTRAAPENWSKRRLKTRGGEGRRYRDSISAADRSGLKDWPVTAGLSTGPGSA